MASLVTTTVAGNLAVTKTTEQLRLLYDSTNYSTFTTTSNGSLTVQAGSTASGDLFLKAAGSSTIEFDTDGASSGEQFKIKANQGSGLVDLLAITRAGAATFAGNLTVQGDTYIYNNKALNILDSGGQR